VRARSKIATARIPYAVPSDAELPGRLAAGLAVVYLIATEAQARPAPLDVRRYPPTGPELNAVSKAVCGGS
jgi:RNA polymerase sigma-70 factor (ECF subfamily)